MPIGNAGDITLRALDLLRRADAVACEDTRTTGKLLGLYEIKATLLPYHDHNADAMRPVIVGRIAAGQAVALVADAGLPLISDPGYKLVRAVREAGLPVTCLPGASAPLAALLLSGLPSDRFMFAGFPPAKTAARRRFVEELAAVPATLILFEAPHRLAESLADLAAVLGDREAAVARELTKRFEEVRPGRLTELAEHYAAAGPPRGEIVVVVGPPLAAPAAGDAAVLAMLRDALGRMGLREAAALVAGASGRPRRDIYRLGLSLKGEGGGGEGGGRGKGADEDGEEPDR